LFKTELIRRKGPWRGLDAVEIATMEWVDWYNNRRLFSAIGNIPPAEAETNHSLTTTPSVILQMGDHSTAGSTEPGAVQNWGSAGDVDTH
jgi:putative transposase